MYKQAVSTADAYLGMAHNKDPGSRSCEDLVFVAHLPGTTALADLDLDVQADRLRLVSQRHKLSVYLPHRVDADGEGGVGREDGKVGVPSIVDEDRPGSNERRRGEAGENPSSEREKERCAQRAVLALPAVPRRPILV